MAVTAAQTKTSIAMGGKTMAFNPMMQYIVADMYIELEAITAHLDRIAADWSNGVDHGMAWPAKLVAAKLSVVEGARRVVLKALDVVGGSGIYKRHPLERLLRDSILGPLHPADTALTHEIVGKTALGAFGPARWG